MKLQKQRRRRVLAMWVLFLLLAGLIFVLTLYNWQRGSQPVEPAAALRDMSLSVGV